MNSLEKTLNTQIEEFNIELTISSICFIIFSFFSNYLIIIFLNNFFSNPQTYEYYQMSLLLNDAYVKYTSGMLNLMICLIIILSIWTLLNIVQIICNAIDQIKRGVL
jgi:hypothetical protein